MTANGPYLYDVDPAPLHTGAPRNRNWSIVVLLALTVLLAIGTVVGMYFFRGTPTDEGQQVAGVFVAALAADDVETAHGLLCEDERARLAPEDVPEEYGPAPAELGTATVEREDGEPVQVLPVTWADGTTGELRLIPEGGPRVCGLG